MATSDWPGSTTDGGGLSDPDGKNRANMGKSSFDYPGPGADTNANIKKPDQGPDKMKETGSGEGPGEAGWGW